MTEQEKLEKVIKGLEAIVNDNWMWKNAGYCAGICKDALALLKEQEPLTDVSISSAIECLLHPQDADDSDMVKAIDTAVRAMRLLKEQEPIELKIIDTSNSKLYHSDMFKNYYCGNCGEFLHVINRRDMFCSQCGRKVRWT